MEEEIDLRPYILTLIKNWKWIIGTSITMAIIAFTVNTFAAPSSYSATAIVAVIASTDAIEIDLGIVEIGGKQPLSAFPDLALSDEVLNNLLVELSLQELTSIAKIRQKLDAESGKDTSLIVLTTTFEDPEMAARVANAWANSFVDWANRLYVGQSEERVLFFEDQLVVSEQELSRAETSLEEFQVINQTQVISNTLSVYQQRHTEFLLQQARIDQLLENAHALREQMASQPTTTGVSYTDQLTFLQLQLQSFNNESALPIILQIDSQEVLTTENRNNHIEIIDGLTHTLEGKAVQNEAHIIEIEPQILILQQDRQTAITKLNRLNQDLSVAQQTYAALAYQVAEERIAAQDTSSGFQLASRAVVPAESDESGRLATIVIAAILGAMLSLLVIVIVEWWRMQNETTSAS